MLAIEMPLQVMRIGKQKLSDDNPKKILYQDMHVKVVSKYSRAIQTRVAL